MCRTAVELSIAGTECAWLARGRISTSVMGGSEAHSGSRSGGRRGGRGRDTTMLIRQVSAIVVTVYLALSLPIPDSGGTLAIDLNDGDDFSCGCSGEEVCLLGGSRSCVLANVGMRHRRQVGPVQGSNSRSH